MQASAAVTTCRPMGRDLHGLECRYRGYRQAVHSNDVRLGWQEFTSGNQDHQKGRRRSHERMPGDRIARAGPIGGKPCALNGVHQKRPHEVQSKSVKMNGRRWHLLGRAHHPRERPGIEKEPPPVLKIDTPPATSSTTWRTLETFIREQVQTRLQRVLDE